MPGHERWERMIFPEWVLNPGNEEYRRITQIGYGTVFLAVIILAVYAAVAISRGDTLHGFVMLFVAAALVSVIGYHRRTKGHPNHAATVGVLVFGFYCFYLIFSGVGGNTTFVWAYAFPLMAMFIMGSQRGAIAVALFLLPVIIIMIFDRYIPYLAHYPLTLKLRFIPSLLVISALSYMYERNIEKTQQRLKVALTVLGRSKEDIERQVRERTFQLHQANEKLLQEIQEHKRTEEALRASEVKYRLLTDKMNDVVWTANENLEIVYVGPSIEKALGYSPEEHLARDIHERVTPASMSIIQDLITRELVLERGGQADPERTVNVELEYYHRDGSTRWFEQVISGIRDDQGRLTGVHGVGRDITKRKEVEKALRESEQRMRLALEGTDQGLWEFDLLTGKVCYSHNWHTILGYGPEESIFDYEWWINQIHPQSRPVFEKALLDYMSGNTRYLEWEYQIRNKSGEWQWINALGIFIESDTTGVPIRMIGTHRNITTRKQTEEAVSVNEERYRNIFENAIEGIYQSTPEGGYISVNPSMAKICGYESPEEMVSTISDISNQYYLNPQDRERYKNLLDEHGRIDNFEYQVRRKDNRPIWVSASARLVRNDQGKLLYYEGTVQDITDRKRAGEERRDLEERLNRAEKMEALGTLAGGVAHDLNNVLGILVGYSELLLEKLPENSPLRKYADYILQSGVRGAAVIQDLLTLARRGVNVSEVINLNRIIIEYLMTPEFENLNSHHPRVKIRTELEKDHLNIKGSPVHLGKTIMNLVSNAVEAIIPGQGEVTIRTERCYLDQPIRGYDEMKEGDYAVLTVSDTGSGISANDLGKIFDPFYTKKVMGKSGTGLGLAVVWGTVKDHHGYIDVQSEEGKGSTFTLYFPVTPEEIGKVGKSITPSAFMGKGESILIVDDVREQRELATSMLVRLGYQAAAVASGEEAITYLKNKKADLIVLDMIMEPGIDGMETYRRILEIHPGQKAIIVSGFSETDRVRKAQKMGAGAFVRKPYILEKIGIAIREELSRKVA